ncbi:MAG: hypothetical protein IT503_01080 [Burkholderiaceae bacterium]|nr:MAG: hypothetical protein F9K36_14650 [Burkholderiaceae bacterium]MBE7425950.1 hypothetical protein [Ideonella sp.]MCC7284748.1 hypothetical protein [Burkholderiaceae bacterium]
MPNLLRYLGQFVAYAAFAAVIGVFATWPAHRLLGPDQALLRLSFSHPGKVSTECRQRTAEELAKMQPQMRTPLDCQRERSPVQVRVVLDDHVLIDRAYAPAGLSRDGASSAYWREPIAAGTHRLSVTLRDDLRPGAPAYHDETTLDVKPGQIVLIDFKPEQGGVVIR